MFAQVIVLLGHLPGFALTESNVLDRLPMGEKSGSARAQGLSSWAQIGRKAGS